MKYEVYTSSGELKQYVTTLADLATQVAMWELNIVSLPQALAPLNQLLQSWNRVPTDVFLLPGAQPSGIVTTFANNAFAVDGSNDATVVLEA